MTKICYSCKKEIIDDECSIYENDLWFCCECMDISKYTIRGTELINKGDFEEGIEILKKAITTKPTDAEAWFRMGKAYMALAEFQDAVHCFTEASKYGDAPRIASTLAIARSRAMGFPNLSELLPQEAQLKLADQVYWANIKDPEDVSEEYNENGIISQMSGDFKDALECYEKALEKNPHNKVALRNKERIVKTINRLNKNSTQNTFFWKKKR